MFSKLIDHKYIFIIFGSVHMFLGIFREDLLIDVFNESVSLSIKNTRY